MKTELEKCVSDTQTKSQIDQHLEGLETLVEQDVKKTLKAYEEMEAYDMDTVIAIFMKRLQMERDYREIKYHQSPQAKVDLKKEIKDLTEQLDQVKKNFDKHLYIKKLHKYRTKDGKFIDMAFKWKILCLEDSLSFKKTWL